MLSGPPHGAQAKPAELPGLGTLTVTSYLAVSSRPLICKVPCNTERYEQHTENDCRSSQMLKMKGLILLEVRKFE
jgi:hypothetical protein